MYLVYLSAENLSNTNFIKELVYNYKLNGPSLLLHESFGSLQDTRFVTKRISALLSESLVVNTALSGDKRDLLRQEGDLLHLRKELILKMQAMGPVFVMNTLAQGADGPFAADPMQVLSLIREEMQPSEVFMFTRNSRSPLVKDKISFGGQEDYDRFIGLYEEEEGALSRARIAAPVTLASPSNFSQ